MKCRVHVLMLMMLTCWASQSSAQPTRAKNFTIGVCEMIPGWKNELTGVMEYSEPENFIGSPIGRVDEYVWSYIHKADSKSEAEQSKIRNIMDQMLEKATATLIKPAQHAKYELEKSISQTEFSYKPQDGYAGKDAFSYLVKYGPYTVKVNSYVHSGVDPSSDDYPDTTRQNVEKICGKRGMVWRVVSITAPDSGFAING